MGGSYLTPNSYPNLGLTIWMLDFCTLSRLFPTLRNIKEISCVASFCLYIGLLTMHVQKEGIS